MTEIDLAVEHELIVAGGWYPGMRAHYLRNITAIRESEPVTTDWARTVVSRRTNVK